MSDYLIVGGGIIGLSIARELLRLGKKNITVIEKESEVAMHSSGRNSGVLHAGFYYNANSLKARFTKEGNKELTEFCLEHKLKINRCAKVVVAKDESELSGLEELKRRADLNSVELYEMDEKELSRKFPEVKTHKKALFSPTTSTIDPKEVVLKLKEEIEALGATVLTNTKYIKRVSSKKILTNQGEIGYDRLINAAGLYADKIAKDFGFGKDYKIIPFKGIYLKDSSNKSKITTNIYPVPNLANPFLGVHFTLTVDNAAKIGPTAIPAFWRENYNFYENFSISEMSDILLSEAKLFLNNAFGFRDLAIDEMKKYSKSYLLNLSEHLVKELKRDCFDSWSTPGIRAQLLNTKTDELVQDFVVEGDENTTHVLNAVSPAFTSSFIFARWVCDNL
jgi:L-2-hydroxyglutarate oxidase LhgO